MCGIAGIFNYRDSIPVDHFQLKRMADSMIHRGPDDEGFFIGGPIGLAHRRLSIIDLAGGHQPMSNEDDSIWVVFNGEIYNYLALREFLVSKGHVFKTRSDTEVIVHAYEEFGVEFVEKLRGMFAFALWDAPRKRLILVRDRLGIKPVYYLANSEQIAFASEIKGILQLQGEKSDVELSSLGAYFNIRYVPGPRTMFQHIMKLPPGHMMIVENGVVTIRKYWEVVFEGDDYRSEKELKGELEDLWGNVVSCHLMSEVPYGVFLSGGIDSSLLVAMMSKVVRTPLSTFSIGYESGDKEHELEFARSVANHWQSDHHELVVTAEEFCNLIPQLVWHLEEPLSDATCIPVLLLSRYAKKHVTVIHSGEGADEIFAGYGRYKTMQWIDQMREIPAWHLFVRILKSAGMRCGASKLVRYLNLSELPLDKRYYGVASVFTNGLRDGLLRDWLRNDLNTERYLDETMAGYYRAVQSVHPLNRMLYIDLKTWLPDNLLLKADKMTMAASIEQRVPYLDHELVEFAATLPPHLKIKSRETKYLLKQIVRPNLPDEILSRPKQGFGVPLNRWFRHELKRFSCDTLLDPTNRISRFINLDVAKNILHLHQEKHMDLGEEIWSLVLLEFWLRTYVR